MARQVTKNSAYKFEDAYDIHGRGVGRLNLDKAAKSKAFVRKIGELARSMKNIPIETGSPK